MKIVKRQLQNVILNKSSDKTYSQKKPMFPILDI